MRRYKPRALSPSGEMIVAAFSLAFIVWLLFVIVPLVAEGFAR